MRLEDLDKAFLISKELYDADCILLNRLSMVNNHSEKEGSTTETIERIAAMQHQLNRQKKILSRYSKYLRNTLNSKE
jgi:hypothetical protein